MTNLLRLSTIAIAVLAGAATCEVPTLELRQLAGDGNFCSVTDDCCVVVDTCQGESFVITADEFDVAKDLVDGRQDEACVRCLTPPVAVECVNGACVGRAFNSGDVSYAEDQPLNSCGARALDTNETDLTFAEVVDGVSTCASAPE